MRRFLLILPVALTLSLSLPAGDWPRFHGPNGQGIADGTLPKIDAKAPLWKVEVPGSKGVGSPVVTAGKVYLQAASTDGAKRTLLCYDAATGKPLWAKDQAGHTAGTHNKNTLASSTPACDDQNVYCVWWDGEAVSLHAYDLVSGEPKWSQPIGPYKSQHGVGHSPAVYKGKVFLNFDQDDKAVMVALDAKTGKPAWSADRPPGKQACYSTPVILEQPGKPAGVVVLSTYAVDSYDPNTGKVLWHYKIEWPKGVQVLRSVGGPTFAGGLVLGSFGQGGGKGERYMVAVKTDGSGDVTAGGMGWELRSNAPYVPSLLVKGDHVYWVFDFGSVYCAKAKTGEVVKTADRLYGGSEVTSSPILVGDKMLTISERGRVVVIKATPELDVESQTEIGEGVFATPAFADGRLYVRGFTHLYCFGKK